MKKFRLPLFIFILLFLICTVGAIKPVGVSFASSKTVLVPVYLQDRCYELNFQYRNDQIEKDIKSVILKTKAMGFSNREVIKYLFSNYEEEVQRLKSLLEQDAVDSVVDVSGGVAHVTKEQVGQRVDDRYLDCGILNHLAFNKKVEVVINQEDAKVCYADNIKFSNLKSEFVTYIWGNNQEGRINNIAVALSKFNGKVVKPNEVVSFNRIVGETSEQNGFKKAKIIVNGEYVDDFGGGVCQAATTIYNALLLAGVDVVEANPHSLKVGYVKGSFDAMVATGLSDLVFKNNTNGNLYFYTYCNGKECGVKIFGEENEYEIKRRSEDVDFSAEKFPNVAYKTEGYLEYYKNGEKVKEEKIRRDSYFKVKKKASV